MKLRNFLYLNTKIIEDYIAAIDGYNYDEESHEIETSNEKNSGGRADVKVISGEHKKWSKEVEGVKREVRISDAAKFDKVFNYLKEQNENGQVEYYEFIADDIFEKLSRDDFIEVLVTARFSKMKEVIDSAKKISDLACIIQNVTGEQIFDRGTQKAMNGITALEQLKAGKGITCVFEFQDRKCSLVANLDEKFFRCDQENFVGESYMLCKITRKINPGQNIKLDELFEDIKKLPMNRETRRKMPKNLENPNEIKDVVKGPAMVVVPIAVYQ